MATVFQPPFYVPRLTEAIYWQGRPRGLPASMLSSLLQLYVASPQFEPTGDRSISYWTPTVSRNLVLFSTPASTQPPTPRWQANYPRDLPLWQGQPLRAFALGMPATVKFFGATGQAPTKRWRYDYQLDPPIWVGRPRAGYLLNVPSAPPVVVAITKGGLHIGLGLGF